MPPAKRASAPRIPYVVGHKIEERPFTSLIITFVVGLVLGVLFGRRW